MAIVIPVNTYIVTLNGVDPRWTDDSIRSAFQGANRIWSKSGISFSVRSVGAFSDSVINGPASGAMNNETFFYLLANYPGRDYPVAFFVHQFAGTEGGTSTVIKKMNWGLAVGYSSNQAENSRILSHELGHLVSLDHVDKDVHVSPKTPMPAWMRKNLMYSAISLDTQLGDDQINAAKDSALAKKFGG